MILFAGNASMHTGINHNSATANLQQILSDPKFHSQIRLKETKIEV